MLISFLSTCCQNFSSTSLASFCREAASVAVKMSSIAGLSLHANHHSHYYYYRKHKLPTASTNASGYHPQTDGLVERFHSTLIAMLSKYVDQHGCDWDRFLPYMLYAYRVSIQESTRESRFLFNSHESANFTNKVRHKICTSV